MRILVIANTLPFPPRNGVELPLFKIFASIGARHEVDFLIIGKDREDYDARKPLLPATIRKTFFIEGQHRASWKRTLREIHGSAPAFYKYGYESEALKALASNFEYDATWVCTPGNWTFIESCQKMGIGQFGKLILGLNDLATSIYAKHIAELWHRGQVNRRFIAFWFRSFFIARTERQYLKQYDLVHVQTQKEQEKAIKLLGSRKWEHHFLVAPNGVKTELLDIEPGARKRNVILMMTHLDGDRSRESKWFTKHVWPSIRENTDADLWLVGTPPTQDWPHLQDDRIKIKGYVASLVDLYQSIRMAVVPIFHNCGLINRIQDGLAAGVPIVTTEVAGRTFMGLEHGKHCLMADQASIFAEQTIHLYNNPTLQEKLSVQGEQYARSLPTWDDTAALVENSILSLTGSSVNQLQYSNNLS